MKIFSVNLQFNFPRAIIFVFLVMASLFLSRLGIANSLDGSSEGMAKEGMSEEGMSEEGMSEEGAISAPRAQDAGSRVSGLPEALRFSADSRWIQGGMIKGEAPMGTVITVLGRAQTVGSQQFFVFGFGRDTAKTVSLEAVFPSGKKRRYQYDIEQRSYREQYIEGVAKKYVAPPQKVLERISRENRLVKRARQAQSNLLAYRQSFILPARGPITGVYGSRRVFNGVPKRPHFGLDIAGPVGTPVHAPVDGKVVLVYPDMFYSGGTLIVDHGAGISSTFIHLSKIVVNEGDFVKQGQHIADIGATGRATGPHLDWRINWFEQRLDPALLVRLPDQAPLP